MIRAVAVHPHPHKEPADTVVLDHEDRRRRRMVLTGRGGLEVLLDLPEAVAIPDGAALILEDGREVEVEAAPEALAAITARDAPSLMRIAWHLGNRHLPTELLASEVRIRRDHVIEDMVRGLGGTVTPIDAPFEPESGAYAGQGGGHHGHGHGHAHHEHGHGERGHDHHGHSDHGPTRRHEP